MCSKPSFENGTKSYCLHRIFHGLQFFAIKYLSAPRVPHTIPPNFFLCALRPSVRELALMQFKWSVQTKPFVCVSYCGLERLMWGINSETAVSFVSGNPGLIKYGGDTTKIVIVVVQKMSMHNGINSRSLPFLRQMYMAAGIENRYKKQDTQIHNWERKSMGNALCLALIVLQLKKFHL